MKTPDTQQIVLWFRQPANWLPALQWSVWILALFWLAKTVWVWVDYFLPSAQPQTVLSPTTAQGNKRQQRFSVDSLVNRHLLGSAAAQPIAKPTVTENVQETRLNLKLRGIYAVDDLKRANAIIEDDRGKQAVYFINDKLKVSGQVFLREVQANRVVLETNGRREALTLKELSPEGVVLGQAKPGGLKEVGGLRELPSKKVLDRTRDKQLTKKLNDYRDKLKQNPLSFSEVISGRPELQNGELIGFRISPGKDRRLFSQLGLRRNDIVTAVNGVPLTSLEEAMGLFNQLDSFDNVDVDIKRGREDLSLVLDLNQQDDSKTNNERKDRNSGIRR